ncbi:discoidin domain-containing protein [Thomasclavelia cocleata]|uniref:discoidin domain-containing protein n=2 Tax=Thomasclavelia cocleata TaxID=69824 RepID=UPI002589EE02|nr:discoidin domain-containing protein [Thomasclavelia cocleata]
MKRKRLVSFLLSCLMVIGLIQVTPTSAANENIALNKPTTESSVYPGSGKDASKAVDGDTNTRWSTKRLGTGTPAEQWDSNFEQWMMVDLQQEYPISQININWEAATATKYTIQGSLDGENFFDVLVSGATEAGLKEHKGFEVFTARYIRILCQEAKTAKYGYSIYELEVYSQEVYDAGSIIDEIEKETPVLSEDGQSLVIPTVPDGYKISLYGTDNEQVVSKTGKVIQPLIDMPVNIMYKVENVNDETDTAVSDDIAFVVNGKYDVLQQDNKKPNVVPGFREWKGAAGDYQLTDSSRIVILDDKWMDSANMIKTYFKDMLGHDIEVVNGQPQAGDIVLKTGSLVEEVGNEGYYLNIADYVTIEAPTYKGMIYGGASITQILYQNGNTAPKGIARDYPQYEVRAGMIDVGRMYIPLEYLEEMTIYMSWYKLNEAHIHINDYWGQSGYSAFRLESEVYPSIVATDGYYTKEEYKQYQKDMKNFGIDIITEIDTPYHAEAFREVPGVRMLANKAGYLDITTDEAFNANIDIIKKLFDEYLDGDDPIIQSDKFHIGTDEYDKKYGEQMRKWTDQLIKYVNAKGYESRVWASLGKNGFNGTTPVTNEATMNLWAPYWADVHETYDAGYDVINTYGGWLYIVPAANAGYPDRIDVKRLYEQFEVNNFKSGRNPSGEAIMPVAHPQTKGAEFALWNDMTSFRTGFSWFDIYDRIKDAVSILAEKTWYGEDEADQTYEQFRERIDALQHKVPNANPGRYVESKTDQLVSYDFKDASDIVADLSGNGYDGTIVNGQVNNGQVVFNGDGYLSLPMDSIGYPYTVFMKLNLNEITENTTLFAGKEGTFFADMDGKLGYSRDQYSFTFDYTLEANKDIDLVLACDNKNLTLYINGKKIGNGKLTNATIAGKTQQSSTFVLPVEKVFENASGTLSSMSIYNKAMSADEIADILGYKSENYALNRPVSVSGLEVNDGRFTAEMAVDGIVTKESRVSFAKDKDEQWLLVDLEETKIIDEINIRYESAVDKYEIQVSEDGEEFTTVYTKDETTANNGPEVDEVVKFDAVEARYVKYVQKQRWHHSGNGKWYSGSIYEFEVYGPLETELKPSKDALIAKGPNSSGSLSANREIGPSETYLVDVEFDMVTTIAPDQTNTAVGLGNSGSNYTAYGQVPVIIRMYQGTFGAYNGNKGYVQSTINFEQNVKYHIRVQVNLKSKTYSAYVTVPGGKEVVFAENFGYRSSAAAPSNIGKIYLFNNERPEASYWLDKIKLKDVADTDTSAVYDRISELEELLTNSINTEAKMTALQEAIDLIKAKADDYTVREENLAALEEAYETFMTKEEDKVRIGSFNIAAGKKPDVNKIREQLEKYDVDIAGIQEVDKNTGRNNYDMLEVFKGDVYGSIFFSKAIDYSGGEYGIGTVSKAPLNDGSTVMLDSDGNEQRVYQRNVVELNGHRVAFYNTHLSYENTELRHQQMSTLKAAMDSDPLPYRIVVGDFNADQYREEFAEIFGENYNIANGMNDIFFDTFNGVDATMNVNSVDNVIVSKNIDIEVVQMIDNRLSDHNMFFADITFKAESTVSKAALQIAVEMASAVTAEDLDKVVPAVVTEFNAALEEARAILANDNATQEEVDASFARLSVAMHMLEFLKGDKTELQDLVDSTAELVEGNYTEESWSVLQEALTNANTVLNNENAMQEEVDGAYDNLQAAINGLEEAEVVDKSLLEAMVNKVLGLEEDKYIASSWQAMLPELEAAQEVLGNEKATQAEVDEACDALTRGYLNLRLKPNKDLLSDLINKANGLNSASYTANTWAVVENEVIKAQAVLEDPEASEAEVKAAEKALTKALEGLVAKPGNTVDTSTPVKAGDTTVSIKTGDNGLTVIFAGLTMLSLAGLSLLRRKED